MFTTLQVVTLMLVALAMAPAVVHVLEFPGKMRLSKDAYFTVQRIYYPGVLPYEGGQRAAADDRLDVVA
jgi:hypothetical protein